MMFLFTIRNFLEEAGLSRSTPLADVLFFEVEGTRYVSRRWWFRAMESSQG